MIFLNNTHGKEFRRGGARAAFTLVEFLLALGIFSILALTLYTVYTNGIQVHQAAERTQRLTGDIRWSLETLTQDLENAIPYTPAQKKPAIFEGQKDRLTVLTRGAQGPVVARYSLQAPEATHIYKITVNRSTKTNVPITLSRLQQGPDVSYFTREEIPFAEALPGGEGPSRPAQTESSSEVLSTQVQRGSVKFSFGYKDKEAGNSRVTWREDWTSPQQPAGVRVEMTFIDPSDPEHPVTVTRNIYSPTGIWGKP